MGFIHFFFSLLKALRAKYLLINTRIHIILISVSSGGQGMAFYWRGNQVFTKQGPIDDDDDKGWTTFLMDTREPLEVNISWTYKSCYMYADIPFFSLIRYQILRNSHVS
jgi:hypothetical protein